MRSDQESYLHTLSVTQMANAPISRRQLFRGDLRGNRTPLRPPWAVPATVFTVACDRCGDCARACPEKIIRVADGGFPVVDFAVGGCSFCGECLSACGGKALRGDLQNDRPWAVVARIGSGCLAYRGVVCRSCGEACDEGAIRYRLRVGGAAEPTLIPDSCTGCGYCVMVCPVQALKTEASAGPQAAIAEQENRTA